MKLILEIAARGEGEGASFHPLSHFPATAGRAYGSDVILHDPHAGAAQFRIDRDGAGFAVTDLGALNPTLINGAPFRGARPLASGDALKIGDTVIRAFAENHAVPPPLPARDDSALRWISRAVNVWLLFAIAVMSVAGWSYISIWTDEVRLALAGSAAVTMVTVFVWAALWSVAGRLIRHQGRFLGHVALISVYLSAGAAAAWLDASLSFLASESAAGAAVSYAVNTVLLAALLYFSLALATHGTRRRRLLSALFFSLGLTLGVFTVSQLSIQKFSPDPDFPYRLEPYLGAIAPLTPPDAFLKDSARLFDSGKLVDDMKNENTP